jgi:2-polyprenyl-3-methyl-5-hydroxy-6-metoxy-1,4-benzoquinol methylase
MLTLDEAILELRRDKRMTDLVRDAYLGDDVLECGERFLHSPEFAATWGLVGWKAQGGVVLDVGAGRGIASYAFARSGVTSVMAVEPDPSAIVGCGSLRQLCRGLPVEIVTATGEELPVATGSVDVVYARQVLHHIGDLKTALGHFARALRTGGLLLAAREHVVDSQEELQAFLAAHPVHQLAGGEHAWSARVYKDAIKGAGLTLLAEFGPWESIINAFPAISSNLELRHYPRILLQRRFGRLGHLAGRIPGVESLLKSRWPKPLPGRMHSFLAIKA